jgi:transcriptional regulator with XRE-family HTH domain
MTPQEGFITRLRRHRERNQISLDELVTKTRVKREQLEAFERGDLENWPRGIYARAWVRAYATVVGLDPSDTVDEFCRLFPHGDRRAQPTFREYAAIIAHQSTYRDEFEHLAEEDRRRSPEGHRAAPKPSWRRQVQRLVRTLMSLRPARAPRPVRSVRTN